MNLLKLYVACVADDFRPRAIWYVLRRSFRFAADGAFECASGAALLLAGVLGIVLYPVIAPVRLAFWVLYRPVLVQQAYEALRRAHP